MENTTYSRRKNHEIFSCPFGHFVVQKEFLAYPGSLTPYENHIVLLLDGTCRLSHHSHMSALYTETKFL